jgi:hypothetical protein
MLQVGINYSQQVGVGLRPAVNHCARQSAFALSLKHAHPGVMCGASTTHFGGSISAAVINDDEFAIYRRFLYGIAEAL